MNDSTDTLNNMTITERGTRITAGIAIIASVIAQTGPLGLTALLPIAAIYPLLTGFLGWDPVYALTGNAKRPVSGRPARAATA